MVMDVSWRRLCKLGKGEAGKSLFKAANVWCRCAHYFIIASCG